MAFLICMVLATLSPLASSSPDGLEKVASDGGFIDASRGAPFEIVADYVFPGIENQALATILAGWLGTALLFGAADEEGATVTVAFTGTYLRWISKKSPAYGLARLIKTRRRDAVDPCERNS